MWGDTWTAAEIVGDGTTKSNVTVSAPGTTQVENTQYATISKSAVKRDGVAISATANDGNLVETNILSIKVPRGYKLVSPVKINGHSSVSKSEAKMAYVGWSGEPAKTFQICNGATAWSFGKNNQTSEPSDKEITFTERISTIYLYTQIKAADTNYNSFGTSKSVGSGTKAYVAKVEATAVLAPEIVGVDEIFSDETITLEGYPASGNWAVTAGPATITSAGVLTANGSGTVIVSYTYGGVTETKNITAGTTKHLAYLFNDSRNMPTAAGVQAASQNASGTAITLETNGNIKLANTGDFVYIDLTTPNYTITSVTVNAKAGSDSKNVKFGSSISAAEDGMFDGTSKSDYKDYTFTPTKESSIVSIIKGGTSFTIASIILTVKKTVTHHVTYALGTGATGTAPTQDDVAEGSTFTVADVPSGVTPPTGKKFSVWNDGTNDYAAGDTYTMGTSDVTLTAQWVEDVPDPTVTFEDATYILGASALDMSAKFTSNSSGAVTYTLKDATTDAAITSVGSFTATAAGEYVVVASQAAVAGSYAAISKEATVTVLDNELSDTYVWKKGTSYTGCVANPNADAPAAQYTDIAYEGFTGMGRAATDNTECILTFTVKAAYSATFGIKSICTYGKLEEPLGGQISWDGGTNWEDFAEYSEQAKTLSAPAGTFPASFKIKFQGVSKDKGGLYWRNALVTLQVKKTVSGTVEELTNVKVNGVAISAADLATLKADKSLAIATTYATAPTVTFVKKTTTSYSGGWADDVTSTDVDVVAGDNTTNWSASTTINTVAHTVTLAKPAGPSLETEATGLTLTSAKMATDTKTFTFSGINLTTDVTIALESAVAGMTVSPETVTPTAGTITDQEVTVTYKSLETVAETNVNLVVSYNEDTKLTIPLTYSSTEGFENLVSISAATTWNWNGAANEAFETLGQDDMIVLANADVTWNENFNANAIAGALQHYYREGKYAQGNSLKFNTTIPGKVFITYSNTGNNDARTVNVNGAKGSLSSSNNKDADKCTESFAVSAGDVLIRGVQVSDDAAKMLRFYEVRFAPVFAVTYDAGTGAVKDGETLPTQADEAAGEKITLAAATALEKSGYDFTGWLCDIDGVTYDAGAEYTMTAAATTFTAQWIEHVDPVDPTLTYDDGEYMVGATALDLSTLITAATSTGAITYSVKTDGGTGATIDGTNFTATAAGTATVTASQAAVSGFNAISVDFDVVVTEATEIDGVKLVSDGALTGNFRVKASQLQTGNYTVEGVSYSKYVKMGSTHTGNFSGETEGSQTKGIYYAPTKKNITFWFYMQNTETSTARNITIYTIEEGKDIVSTSVEVAAGAHLVSADIALATNAEIVFGVDNTKLYFCQIVAVESGDDLLRGGQNGYVFDYSKKRQNVAANTLRTIDGMDYYLFADSKINSASNVQLATLGTHYIKFHLDAPMTVNVSSDNKKYYLGSECSTEDAAKLYESNGAENEFSLTSGDWYINGSGNTVKITKIAFTAPKCAEPAFNALANSELCAGEAFVALDGTATVADAGTPIYQWYNADGDVEIEGATNATYTPTADGSYYVIATNQLSGYSDNTKQSATVTVTHFAAAEITEGLVNLRGAVDATVTLQVEATGKNLHYTWKECATEDGTYTDVAGAADNKSLAVTITAGLSKYIKVVVSSDCGADLESVAKVEEFVPVAQQDVTESIVWDWTKAASVDEIKLTSSTTPAKNEGFVMANGAATVYNNANFESDKLYLEGEYITRKASNVKFFQGQTIKFHTTVAGAVRVTFSHTGSDKPARELYVNGVGTGTSVTGTTQTPTGLIEVPAGDVEITAYHVNSENGAGQQYVRIYKMEFFALAYTRADSWMAPGELGTICYPEGLVAVGADLYQMAGVDENRKFVFDEVTETEPGVPYLFEAQANVLKFYATTATAAGAAGTSNGMVGTFSEIIIPQTTPNTYYFSGRKFYAVTARTTDLTVPANRAYVDLNESHPAGAPRHGARRITFDVQGANTTTGMGEVQGDQVQATKLLINGQLFILRGDKMYDATGKLMK